MSTATLAIPGSLLRGQPGHRRRRHCDRCDIPMGARHGTLCTDCVAGVLDANQSRTEETTNRLTPECTTNGRVRRGDLRLAVAEAIWHG